MSLTKTRDEHGAIAVMFAILVSLLFVVAALGVDLGNAMNRKKQVQTQADLAALAGGANLPAPSLTAAAGDDQVKAVAEYLIENKVYDDTGSTSIPAFTASEDTPAERASKINALATKLVSTDPADLATYGHVYYGKFSNSGTFTASKNFLTVVAPRRTIQFGLASAVGFNNTTVQARATAGIFSKGSIATLPFYAYDGCDWGQQEISHGTMNSSPPNLYVTDPWAEGGSGGSKPTLNAPGATGPNSNPQSVILNDTTTTLRVFGTNLGLWDGTATSGGVMSLGFFLPDGSAPAEIQRGDFLAGGTSNEIRVNLSTVPGVAANDGKVFYLRVKYRTKSGSTWETKGSPLATQMAYLSVGTATLYCNDMKNSGNFGSLSVARSDSTKSASDGWLPRNIALGLQVPEVKLNPYTATVTASSCNNGDPYAVDSDAGVSTEINCLTTDTGFPQNPATNGFVTGVNGTIPGRLTEVSSGCGAANNLPPTRIVIGYTINNEVLSCYLTDTSTKLATISSEGYSGDPVFDPDIYSSPRFFWIPVVSQQPTSGKKSYPIIDFRAAFMTGENGDAFKGHANTDAYYYEDNSPSTPNWETNGLTIFNNQVESFRVVFINSNALPPLPGGGQPKPYIEGTPSFILLVD